MNRTMKTLKFGNSLPFGPFMSVTVIIP